MDAAIIVIAVSAVANIMRLTVATKMVRLTTRNGKKKTQQRGPLTGIRVADTGQGSGLSNRRQPCAGGTCKHKG